MSITPIVEVMGAAHAAEEAGDWDRALATYQRALEEWEPLGGAPTCELLRKIGLVHYYRGDLDIALNLFQSSRRLATESALVEQIASATNCLGIVHQAKGQLDIATQFYRTAQELAEGNGDRQLSVMIDQNLGIIACIRGDTTEALQRYESALAHYRELEDPTSAARVLNNIGMLYVDTQAWGDAERTFDAAIAVAERAKDVETVATVQLNRSELYMALQRYDDARACCDQAFEIFSRIGSSSGLGETYRAYGALYRESGKPHLAEAHLSLVVQLAQTAGDKLLEAEAETDHALVHLSRGRNPNALRSLSRAHRLFSELQARRELHDVEGRLDKLEESYLQVTQTWGESIEAKDRYTAGHCIRVADYTCRLAEAVGMRGRDLVWIRMGAFLHDVGKTSVDGAILNKLGSLDPREWEEMRRHTIVGDEIVSDLHFPFDIRPMVRSHHERWDGEGYPDRLCGEQIPITARALSIADAYDALTTNRSYRAAQARAEALDTMRKGSGTHFDPRLLAAFCRLMGAEAESTQVRRE